MPCKCLPNILYRLSFKIASYNDNLQGGGGARLTGHIQIEGNEDQLRATINDIEQRCNLLCAIASS